MSDLLWPGDERAGRLMTDSALLRAMVAVESAWLAALVDLEVAEAGAADDLADLAADDDLPAIAAGAEAGGNPVIPLVALLRSRLGERSPAAARWVHQGLTSQDVLDTALQLCLRDVTDRLERELRTQVTTLAALATQHRATVMVGRTLTQHAVPVTFGLKVATWLTGVLEAADDLHRAAGRLSAQLGGAAGTLAATTALAGQAGRGDAARTALEVTTQTSRALGLAGRPPWHTSRATVTRLGDALASCTDAWGRIANDVLTLSRPEIAELAEPVADGRGGSSAMPHKTNPILSVLVRRAALAGPPLAAQLHLASADARDERPDGAWHTEWSTLRTIARRAVVAADQTTELVRGLTVDVDRMRANAAASDDLLAEARAVAARSGGGPTVGWPEDYLGATELLIDVALDLAAAHGKDQR
jgi:3-carboxy-cis,cis-muconate cycloisomerase